MSSFSEVQNCTGVQFIYFASILGKVLCIQVQGSFLQSSITHFVILYLNFLPFQYFTKYT